MSKVATNMIIGNRIEQYAKFALLSTKWVDEKVIVNTGTKDNPNLPLIKEICPEAKIIQFEGPFDFASARNLALKNTDSQWVLWQDFDEVHFNSFEEIVRYQISMNFGDGIQFAFYHFLLDMFHYQSVDTRVNLFRKEGKFWRGKVHEQVFPFEQIVNHDYKYHHYGYTKPQKDIYENWKLYWSLNEPERYKIQEPRNPNDIISDRVTVAQDYGGFYPEVIQEYLETQKPVVKNYEFIK